MILNITTLLMDMVALASLMGTGEIAIGVLWGVFGIFLLALATDFGRRLTLASGVWYFFIVSSIVAALLLWLRWKLSLILAVADATMILHASLWLLTSQGRSWALRMGLGFTELIVASVLTSEPYLIMTLFLFALLASVTFSLRFLAQTGSIPPRGYVRRSLFLATGILLSSLVIFPILPRSRPVGGVDLSAQVGYTENVGMALDSLSGDGRGRVAFRIRGERVAARGGLFRGRTLSLFDGQTWSLDREAIRMPGEVSTSGDVSAEFLVEREPLGSSVLPVPYGTLAVVPVLELPFSHLQRLKSGEWLRIGTERTRTQYRVQTGIRRFGMKEAELDGPRAVHLAVAETLRTSRMQSLAKRLLSGGKSAASKVEALSRFFATNAFVAELPAKSVEAGVGRDWHVLERFLFLTQRGHCEWFAASSAVLLRLAGVPTRLVAGFRVGGGALAEGEIVVRSGNAHAWVEYWDPVNGWNYFDPTPRVFRSNSFWSGALTLWERVYDGIADRWYSNIVSYEAQRSWMTGRASLRDLGRDFKNNKMLWIGSGALLSLLIVWMVLRRWRPHRSTTAARRLEGPRWLARLLRKTESRWRRQAATADLRQKQAWEAWRAYYERVRFGKSETQWRTERETDSARLKELARDME